MKLDKKAMELSKKASAVQARNDREWAYFEENVEQLETLIPKISDGLLRRVIGIVIIEIYLNKIERDLGDV